MKRCRVPDCGKPEETCLTLLSQLFERWHNVIEHLLDIDCFLATGFSDRVVQMEDVDAIATQSRQAAFQRRHRSIGNAAELRARQSDLRTDEHVRGLEFV